MEKNILCLIGFLAFRRLVAVHGRARTATTLAVFASRSRSGSVASGTLAAWSILWGRLGFGFGLRPGLWPLSLGLGFWTWATALRRFRFRLGLGFRVCPRFGTSATSAVTARAATTPWAGAWSTTGSWARTWTWSWTRWSWTTTASLIFDESNSTAV